MDISNLKFTLAMCVFVAMCLLFGLACWVWFIKWAVRL